MSAWVIRQARSEDLDAILALARSIGSGMTTLPADPATIAARLAASERSFADRNGADAASFLLVLERGDGRIGGCAGVYADIGRDAGFYSYKRLITQRRSRELGMKVEIDALYLTNSFTGCTEVGTLVVAPDLRASGAARALANSRYLLIACRPDRVDRTIIAEMRGWQDEDGRSPFWDAAPGRYFPMSFDEADRLSAVDGNQFILDLIPNLPILTALLPQSAREAIGRPHASSVPAMAMLLSEGFRFNGFVDVFDAGPQVSADQQEIRTVRESRVAPLGAIPAAGAKLIACDDANGFRVVLMHAEALPAAIMARAQFADDTPVRWAFLNSHTQS